MSLISKTFVVLSPCLNESISSFTPEIEQWCSIFLTNFSLSEKGGLICKHSNSKRSGKASNKLLTNFSSVQHIISTATVWKVSKYAVVSGPYFPTFWLNTDRYEVSLRIQSKCGKKRTRKNFVFRHFLRIVPFLLSWNPN